MDLYTIGPSGAGGPCFPLGPISPWDMIGHEQDTCQIRYAQFSHSISTLFYLLFN